MKAFVISVFHFEGIVIFPQLCYNFDNIGNCLHRRHFDTAQTALCTASPAQLPHDDSFGTTVSYPV